MRLRIICYLCGLLPMLLGTFALLGYYFTRNMHFASAGHLLLLAALPILLVATYFLGKYKRENTTGTPSDPNWKFHHALAWIILIVNIPLAGIYATEGLGMIGRIYVKVENKSNQSLKLSLDGPGISRRSLQNFAMGPGQSKTVYAEPGGDGAMVLRFESGAQKKEIELIGYVITGEDLHVTIDNDLSAKVTDLRAKTR